MPPELSKFWGHGKKAFFINYLFPFAQASFNDTVRLNIGCSGVASLSRQ